MIPESGQKYYTVNETMISQMIRYSAEADHKRHMNLRHALLQMAWVFLSCSILNFFMDKEVKLWTPYIVMWVFCAVMVVFFFITGRKRKFDYFLGRQKKYFHNLMYDANVRSEIDHLISEIQ